MSAPDDLAAFCAREWPRLVGALSLYCGDRAVAEELAQDALERVCRRWSSVRAMEHPSAWVHRVALNLAKSRLRRAGAARRALTRHGPQEDRVDSPDVAAQLTVRDAVAALPARERSALTLRYFIGLSPAEAGEIMGCSDLAVRSLTHRGLSRLRERLGRETSRQLQERSDVC